MDATNLLYLPYRTHYFFSLALLGGCFVFNIGIGYSLSNPTWTLLFPGLFTLFCLTLAKFMYDTSKVSVLLTEDGLRIIGKRKATVQFYAWCDISYMYHTRSKRGHKFIVLSGEALSINRLNQYVATSATRSVPCVESTVTLPIDPLQDTTLLLNYLNDKVSNNVL